MPKLSKIKTIKPGVVLVKFYHEGGRKRKEYRYAGICQKPVDGDGEVQVVCLKVVGDRGSIFIHDKDVYLIAVIFYSIDELIKFLIR